MLAFYNKIQQTWLELRYKKLVLSVVEVLKWILITKNVPYFDQP